MELRVFIPGIDGARILGFCRPRPDRQPPDDFGLITLVGISMKTRMQIMLVAVVSAFACLRVPASDESTPIQRAEGHYVDALRAAISAYKRELFIALKQAHAMRITELGDDFVRFHDEARIDPSREYFEVPDWHIAFPIESVRQIDAAGQSQLLESLASALTYHGKDVTLAPFGFSAHVAIEIDAENKTLTFLVGSGQIAWFPPYYGHMRGDPWILETIPASSDFLSCLNRTLESAQKLPIQPPLRTPTSGTPAASASAKATADKGAPVAPPSGDAGR